MMENVALCHGVSLSLDVVSHSADLTARPTLELPRMLLSKTLLLAGWDVHPSAILLHSQTTETIYPVNIPLTGRVGEMRDGGDLEG